MTCEVQCYVQLFFLGFPLVLHFRIICDGGLAFYFSHSTGSISTLSLHIIILSTFANDAREVHEIINKLFIYAKGVMPHVRNIYSMRCQESHAYAEASLISFDVHIRHWLILRIGSA